MKNYIGIDLGTTNSAICSYDSDDVRLWKSPEQNDVTPSAILIEKRGNKRVGKRAYDSAPWNPDNAATLFKRLMGTSTPIKLPAVDRVMSPEECSAEILKVLFGYLPEEVRNDPETGTVITVPAAFNQMQKDATMQAAELAGIGSVALMQEPVAAVMSVMQKSKTDGTFVIYDLGGGTLDVAIAESSRGKVNLLAHGGIAMCGGRDWDRLLMENIVKPWLFDNFDLPENFAANPNFKTLKRVAEWATEKAKIEISSREDANINLSETETRVRDQTDTEIFLDIPLDRSILNELIENQIMESIEATRETLTKAGLRADDIERVVFIGGPTNYPPLREKVSFELGIPASTEVNSMTAVATGAALFSESIDWSSQTRSRKSNRGKLTSSGELDISFNFTARTSATKAKIAVQVGGEVLSGSEFEVNCLDTGWTSGRVKLSHGAVIDVSLVKNGDNTFQVFVFDPSGGPISLGNDKIVITRTAATVDSIPASHSISVEVLDRLGGSPVLKPLIEAGDKLPKKGQTTFKTIESLKAGSAGSINFKLWEGEISEPITDNLFIGDYKITGSDFDDGLIPAGAVLICDYEMLDSGHLILNVSVPSIGATFSKHNFYSRQEGQTDFSTDMARVIDDGERTLHRLDEINEKLDDPKLDKARENLRNATELDLNEQETEKVQEAMEKVHQACKLIAKVRKENLKELRQMELDTVKNFFDEYSREYARPSEEKSFDNLVRTAQKEIDNRGREFENHLDVLRGKHFAILWRQDWFIVEKFKYMVSTPYNFSDRQRYDELVREGTQLMKVDNIDRLRQVVGQLIQIQITTVSDSEMLYATNIIKA